VTTVEDRLRDAYRAAAETVRPGSIGGPGFRAPTADRPPRTCRRLSRTRVLALPLTAAAAVTAIAVAASMLGQHVPPGPGGHPGYQHSPATKLPYFFVMDYNRTYVFQSVNAATGAVVPIHLPFPERQVDAVAEGEGSTVVIAVSPKACSTTLYRFTLTPAGRLTGMSPLLTVPHQRLSAWGLAVSENGRFVAYQGLPCHPPGQPASRTGPNSLGTGYLALANVSTGRTKRWTFPVGSTQTGGITLSADGSTIVFGSRLLHAGTPAGSLAQRAYSVPGGFGQGGSVASDNLSPDGKTVYFASFSSGTRISEPTHSLAIWAYTIATKRIRLVHTLPGDMVDPDPISLDPTGRYLVAAYSQRNSRDVRMLVYDLRTGAVHDLPHSARVIEQLVFW